VAVRAPWERRTGAVGHVVFRYQGSRAGERTTQQQARAATRGHGCLRGTGAARLVLPVVVRRARLSGDGGRATGAAAWTRVAQPTRGAAESTVDGYYGTQDVPCFPA
jgi:hypothetical protein